MIKTKIKVMIISSAFSMIGFSLFSYESFAQNAISPDNTLPINTSVDFNSANQTYTITGGTQVGTNQFHSFQDFSVPTSNTAHFDTAPTTVNAIGRVTGSNISNIDGILRTNGTTNLYLVNPNGIVFGANAMLDIAGSFSASTANSIKFSDGSEFSATNPQAPPLLNVNVPLGLQYGNSNTGATIVNRGNLSAGQDLTLNADKLDLQGTLRSQRDLTLQAQDTVEIRDLNIDTSTNLAGVNAGNIRVEAQGDIAIANANLRSYVSVFENAGNGGAISLSTGNGTISLTNSNIDTYATVYANTGNGGEISLSTLKGDISLTSSYLSSYSSSVFGNSTKVGSPKKERMHTEVKNRCNDE